LFTIYIANNFSWILAYARMEGSEAGIYYLIVFNLCIIFSFFTGCYFLQVVL